MFLLCFLLLIITIFDFVITSKEVKELRHDLNNLQCDFISYRIRNSAQVRYLEHCVKLTNDLNILENQESEGINGK